MKRPFYITQSGKVSRKNNTVWFSNNAMKKAIPIEAVESIYCLGEVGINSKLLTFLAKQGVLVHFFNYYGYYSGSFYPRESLVSGSVVVDQVAHYTNTEKRLFLARAFVGGMLKNMVRFLEHHRKHGKSVGHIMKKIERAESALSDAKSITEVMNCEAQGWQQLYESYGEIMGGLSLRKEQKGLREMRLTV